jgi:UV DNA damage endonuclease
MFDQSIQRVGFACKYMHPDQSLPPKRLKEIQGRLTESVTTNAWMERQTHRVAYDKLWSLIQHNTQAVYNLIQYVSGLPHGQRMVRLGSDQLPFYTLDPWREFYTRSDVRDFLARQYRIAGDLARQHDVRLSMHPGQFCCIVSDNPDVVNRSLEELEYHADIARWMGYGAEWRDFKINVHLSGRQGSDGFQAAYDRMSPELRNMLTIENDEFGAGLDEVLKVAHLTPIVFDTHHHYINTHGEYLQPSDPRWQRVIESWRGVRPTMHYSVSREEYFEDADWQATLPDYAAITGRGIPRTKLRAHSDMYYHRGLNDYVAQFWPDADIMAEAKHKNLASTQLFTHLTE